MAQHHVVVSGHYYASLAGLQILEAGGNAIDAGVATGLAIDVLESQFVGFGGVAPIMIHLAERDETHVINGVGVWPKAAEHRVLPSAVRRPHSRRAAADRGPRRAGQLDRGARTLRHHVVRRGCGIGNPLRPRRLSDLSVLRRNPGGEAGRDPPMADARLRSFCRTGARRRWARSSCRPISAARCSTWPIRKRPARVAIGLPASARRMMRSIAATSPARSCGIRREHGGWLDRRGPGGIPQPGRSRRAASDSATSMSTAAAPGRRGRWCWRR